jgi:hypothetical protein
VLLVSVCRKVSERDNYHWLLSQTMYFTPAFLSRIGLSPFALMMRWISALDKIPDVLVHSPGFAPPEKSQPGVVQDGLESVNDLP